MDRSKRLTGLDLAKVLALYFVVLYHLTFRNAPLLFAGRVMDDAEYLFSTLLSCCVPLLFAVSGALALRQPVDLKKSVRRSLQVLFLAVIWAVLSLLVVLALRGERMAPGEFFSVIWQLKVGYIQHLWYLPTFFFLCLITPVMQALRNSARQVYRYGLLVLAIFTFGNALLSDGEYLLRWLLGKTGYSGNREFFWLTNFFGWHYWYVPVYYALGAAVVEYQDQLRRYRKAAVLSIPLCMVILFVIALARSYVRGTTFDPVFNNYPSIFTLTITTAILLLLLEAKPGPKLAGFAQAVSSRSLGIYLVHWLLIEVLLDYLPAVTSTNHFAPLTAAVVMALSWAIAWVCGKIPLVKNLFTVSTKWVRQTK